MKTERMNTLEGQQFKEAVVALCKGFGLSISHEDIGGAFIIRAYNQRDVEWFMAADTEVTVVDKTIPGKGLSPHG